MTHLVYVRSLRGPSPQIIHSDAGGGPYLDEGIRGHVLATHKLEPGEDALSLRELEQKYPPPKITEEA